MKKTLILLFSLLCTLGFSQEKRPKVGLVLSGGGAKGFAHIGVLKELERRKDQSGLEEKKNRK